MEKNYSFAKIIACDIANEIINLHKDNKCSDKYDQRVFDLLQQHQKPEFYLSELVDRYIQVDKTKIDKQEKYYSYVLYLEKLPICIINTNIDDSETNRWDHTTYSLNDDKAINIINTDRFYILNADDYGLYLVGDDDYFVLSYPLSENPDFMKEVKQLGIATNTINKNIISTDLINETSFKINIKEYDFVDMDDNFYSLLKQEHPEYFEKGIIFGPVARYQYYFSDFDTIEVVDFDRENGSFLYGLELNSSIDAFIYYDSFDEELNVDDSLTIPNTLKPIVEFSNIAYVSKDKVIYKNDDVTYSLLDQLVIERLQDKIKNNQNNFNVIDLSNK